MVPSLKILAACIKAAGLPVKSVSLGDYSVDSKIKVNEKISVQVGWPRVNYVVVSHWLDAETLESLAERKPTDLQGILADIRSCLEAA